MVPVWSEDCLYCICSLLFLSLDLSELESVSRKKVDQMSVSSGSTEASASMLAQPTLPSPGTVSLVCCPLFVSLWGVHCCALTIINLSIVSCLKLQTAISKLLLSVYLSLTVAIMFQVNRRTAVLFANKKKFPRRNSGAVTSPLAQTPAAVATGKLNTGAAAVESDSASTSSKKVMRKSSPIPHVKQVIIDCLFVTGY